MKRHIVTTLLFVAAALALIGHGAGNPPDCWFENEKTRVFNFVGSCAPAGIVTLKSDEFSCSATLTGNDLGYIPSDVTFFDDSNGGFKTDGNLNSDYTISCSASEQSGTDDLHLVCSAVPKIDDRRNESVKWCEGSFREVATGCDIRQCDSVTCGEDEHVVMGDDCCAVCRTQEALDETDSESDDDTHKDYIEPPETLPQLCVPNECIDSCEEGYDLLYKNTGDCCPVCVEITASCIAGREAMWEQVAAGLATYTACEADTDCAVFQMGSRCGASCPAVMSISAYPAFNSALQIIASENCAECNPVTYNQPDCPPVSGRPFCNQGICDIEPLSN
ncbi:MAG: hypothetical protein JXX14_20635 [Deltaproteobacteria bacterium]|nr:hypothetical protein [Deltaproteobacteria bacterium]